MSATVNSVETIHKGRVFQLVRENITLSKGSTFNMDVIRHPGAAAIVPVTENGNVLMLKQYRHAIGEYIWEIPAGTLDNQEDPLDCAKRELIEETGFSARQWKKLGAITPVPGYSDEKIHLYLATDLATDKQNLGKDEMLDVHEIPFLKVIEMIFSGEISDGKSITGILLADRVIS